MKTPAMLFLVGTFVAPVAGAGCSADCLPDLPGGPWSCDDIINDWRSADNATNAWDGHLEDVTCDVLEELNCCDCSDCLCDGTTTTTTTTTRPECHVCWGFLFGGNSTDPIPNPGDVPGYLYQFFDPANGWAALDEHQRAEGCEAAALNGIDCTNCGCDCGAPPDDVDCVQEDVVCSDCSSTECGVPATITCTYDIIQDGLGLGAQCLEDYVVDCSTECPTTTTTPFVPTTTTTVAFTANCSEIVLVDGVAVLDFIYDFRGTDVDLGGSCASASEYLFCEELEALGANCYDGCDCTCDSASPACNSRPFNDESLWEFTDGTCYSATRCVDPCTQYIGFPEEPTLNATCEELLQTQTMSELEVVFDNAGKANYCRQYQCCTNFTDGGGIPSDANGTSLYECYVPPTIPPVVTTTTTTTTTECDIEILTTADGDNWTATALIERGLSCFQIANAIGGVYSDNVFDPSDTVESVLANLTYYPEFPPEIENLEIAKRCGCSDSCDVPDSCEGCYALEDALVFAGFSLNDYFCEDIMSDFNMDCRSCGCKQPDNCDDKILFSSGDSAATWTVLYDLSCNDLDSLGLNCYEIESYTALHDQAGACDTCNCSLTTETPFCDVPCGGGQYGGNSSSGVMNTSQILSCNAFIDAEFSCSEMADAGCTGCEVCGCGLNTTTAPQTCDSECNDLSLSCNDLVDSFSCSELEHEIFEGCGCDQCGCDDFVEEPTCGTGCMEGRTCDEWVATSMSDRYFYTCANLESNYGCDCSGCECEATTTPPPAVGDCATTTSCLTLDCETVSEMTQMNYYELEEAYGCDCTGCPGCNPTGCEDKNSCDDWQAAFGTSDSFVSCEALEDQLDCDCSGCACTNATTTTTSTITCVTTCPPLSPFLNVTESLTCDDMRAIEGSLSCAYMETFFGCDCSGCLCDEVPDDICLS